jgi:transposase
MRVAELFNRVLDLPGARVGRVEFEDGDHPRLVVHLVRPTRRVMACSGCGQVARSVHDRWERRWRHRDVWGTRCEVRAEVRRVRCPMCGVQAERVPWARPGARFTRPFEDTCAWLTRAAPQSVVARLLGVSWPTVGRIAGRVVAEARAGCDGLDGLRRIGVDEVSWNGHHSYLTMVVCHDSGRVVWIGRGDRRRALERFFDELGPERASRIEAVSADLGRIYLAVLNRRVPHAAVCADPFHLIAAAQFALDRLRAAQWQDIRRSDPQAGRWMKGARFALRRGPGRRTDADRRILDELADVNSGLYRAHLWCDQLRVSLRNRDLDSAGQELDALADAAPTLGHPRFTRLARTLSEHRDQILNTTALGISNARLEAMNSTVNLLRHRARGYRCVDNLIALIHLVCGRVHVTLPT